MCYFNSLNQASNDLSRLIPIGLLDRSKMDREFLKVIYYRSQMLLPVPSFTACVDSRFELRDTSFGSIDGFQIQSDHSSVARSELKRERKESNQMSETSTLISYSGKISKAELAQIPAPRAGFQ